MSVGQPNIFLFFYNLIGDHEMEKTSLELLGLTKKPPEDRCGDCYGLLMNLNIGVTIHSSDTSLIIGNPKATEIFGLTEVLTINEGHIDSQLFTDPKLEFISEDGPSFVSLNSFIARVIQSNHPVKKEMLGVKQAGKEDVVWLMATCMPLFGDNGELREVLTSFIDVTDHKQTEDALRESEKKYRELSIVDDLTQLYNSRHFYDQLKMETSRVNRHGQPLTLLMLDIDNFKVFNDTYGHLEGNAILSGLGQIIKRCLRQTDSAYRYGGEEFMILLPITRLKQGVMTAEKIRNELKKEIFLTSFGERVGATVSIGVVQYRPHKDIQSFIHHADKLMYQAKKSGKDRVFYKNLMLPE